MSDQYYRIEPNSVQETLIIPLVARKVCAERFPGLLDDPSAARICASLDYDFAGKEKLMNSTFGLFGALEAAQRHYDLQWEVNDYLASHPHAAVVNMGCGLDDTFARVDNGTAHGYNIDFPDVIEVRNAVLPAGERERNIAGDLTDYSWMDEIDASGGAVFFAAGVFYYLKTDDVRALLNEMARRFRGGRVVFDACNARGAKMMTKTVIKEFGGTDVKALFSLEDYHDLETWSSSFAQVSAKSYMRGYRDIYEYVGFVHKRLISMCDSMVKMVIARIDFAE